MYIQAQLYDNSPKRAQSADDVSAKSNRKQSNRHHGEGIKPSDRKKLNEHDDDVPPEVPPTLRNDPPSIPPSLRPAKGLSLFASYDFTSFCVFI